MQQFNTKLNSKKPDFVTFEKLISEVSYENRLNKNLKVHTWDHFLNVAYYGNLILQSFPLEPNLKFMATAAFYLHDIGRQDDGWDKGHALRGAIMAEKLLYDKFPFFAYNEIASVVYAIAKHSSVNADNLRYPTIENFNIPPKVNPLVSMCLWDADRLDLLRVPNFYKSIDINYLSTNFAKHYANSLDHLARYNFK